MHNNQTEAAVSFKILIVSIFSSFIGWATDANMWLLLSLIVGVIAGVINIYFKLKDNKRNKEKDERDRAKDELELALIKQRMEQSKQYHEERMKKLQQGDIQALDSIDNRWNALCPNLKESNEPS